MENPYYIDFVHEYDRLATHLGRQQKRTIKKKKAFLEHYRLTNGNIRRSCDLAGITRKTVYIWKEKDFIFKELLPFIGSQYSPDDTHDSLRDLIMSGDYRAVKFFLKKYSPEFKPIRSRNLNNSRSYSRDSKGRFRSFMPPKGGV